MGITRDCSVTANFAPSYRERKNMGRRPSENPNVDISHLPAADRQRGRDFARWLADAMREGQFRFAKELADDIGVSPSIISMYLRGGYSAQNDKISEPEDDTIAAIARATGADEDDGREAAGKKRRSVKIPLIEMDTAILAEQLRAVAKQLEGGGVRIATEGGEIERIAEPDEIEALDWYKGIPDGPHRQNALETLKRLNRLANEAYRNRTDIIGKGDTDSGETE